MKLVICIQIIPKLFNTVILFYNLTQTSWKSEYCVFFCLGWMEWDWWHHLQDDRIHWCPRSHSLSVPHTCCHWGWSPGCTHIPPHRRPHSQAVQQHPDMSLDTNSHTKSKSCWEDRTGLHGETEAKQTKGGQEGKKNGFKKGSRRGGRIERGIEKKRWLEGLRQDEKLDVRL